MKNIYCNFATAFNDDALSINDPNMTDNIQELLDRFRYYSEPSTKSKNAELPEADIRFKITFFPAPGLQVTDKNGYPVSPDWQSTTGACRRLLKAIGRISQDSAGFRWLPEANDTADAIPLHDYPYLIPLIADCEGMLQDADGNPIAVNARHEADITFHGIRLNPDETDSGQRFLGVFSCKKHPVAAFLNDEYVVTSDNTIRKTASVGDRYADLKSFQSEFDADSTGAILSMLLSVSSGIGIDIDGFKTSAGKHPVIQEPTLIFEKIDSDNALHLRVATTINTIPPDLCSAFRFSRVAIVDSDEITIRQVQGPDSEECVRQIEAELSRNAPSRSAAKDIYRTGNLFVVPPETASPFLFNTLPALLSVYKLIGAEKLKTYKITAVTPRLNLKLSSGIDFLEGKADVEIAGEKFTLNDLLAQFRKNRYVTLSDGNRALLESSYIKRLERIFSHTRKDSDEVKLSFFDLPEISELIDNAVRQEAPFKAYRDFYEGFKNLKDAEVETPGLKATLRGYQKEGVKWIDYLHSAGMGGCLADDMGLGKTVQTIAMLCRTVSEATKPSLIVMPRSLLFNWGQEFRKFAPHIDVATYYGAARDLGKALESQVILTSYAVLRNDIERLSKIDFDYVILDESQSIKNLAALTTKAVWILRAPHRLAISGTPIENNLTELYSLFRFLNPAMFGSAEDFNRRYALPIQKDGDDDTASALRRRVFPFILRRLKKDVLTDLPERTEQILTVEMSPEQARFYEERRRYFESVVKSSISAEGVEKARFELFRALSELRQIASIPEEKSDGRISSPKIELLVDNIVQSVENGHKVVAFFNFLAGIELTGQQLEKMGIQFETMTGATSNRRRVVERFQNDPDCKVLLMTVKTGGVGLNLTAADTVFIAEPWWNKAAELQAINRLHRIGQKNCVNCYYLVTTDTIEEKIRQLQEQKSALVDAIISSDSKSGKQLSADDIAFLLG